MTTSLKKIFLSVTLVGLLGCQNNDTNSVMLDVKVLGCENYQSISVDKGILYNNVWNYKAAKDFPWEQCLVQKPNSSPPVYGWAWRWPENGRNIYGYPQIKRGVSPWDPLPKTTEKLPIQLKLLDSLIVSHELEINADAEFNVATSMWMTNTPDIGDKPNPLVITAEVMVWTYTTAKHLSPAGEEVGVITVDAKDWSVWVNKNWGDASKQNDNKWVYVTLKAETESLINSFDAVKLLNDPIFRDLNLDESYIADIELGTEVMRGRGVVWVKGFDIEIK